MKTNIAAMRNLRRVFLASKTLGSIPALRLANDSGQRTGATGSEHGTQPSSLGSLRQVVGGRFHLTRSDRWIAEAETLWNFIAICPSESVISSPLSENT